MQVGEMKKMVLIVAGLAGFGTWEVRPENKIDFVRDIQPILQKSCVECHGPINKMDEVYQNKPLSMTFCLDCHRHPESKVRPPDKITDLNWKWRMARFCQSAPFCPPAPAWNPT